MSTLKKNKRIKLAKKVAKYGDNKPTFGNSIEYRGKAKYWAATVASRLGFPAVGSRRTCRRFAFWKTARSSAAACP